MTGVRLGGGLREGWFSRRPVVLLWLIAIAFAALALWLSTDFVGRPFAGFRTDLGNVVSVNRDEDWPQTIKFGDLLHSVDGMPVSDRASLLRVYEQAGVGAVLNHRVLRDGQWLTVPLTVRTYTWSDWLNPLIPFLVFGTALAALGLFIAVMGSQRPEAGTFSALCTFFFLTAISGASIDLYLPLKLLAVVSATVLGGLFVSLAIQLGPGRRFYKWPIVLSLIYGLLAVAIVPNEGIASVGLERMTFYTAIWQTALIYWPLAALVVFLPIMARNLWISDINSLAAQQNRVIFWGALVSFMPVAIVWFQPLVTGRVLTTLTNYSLFFLLLFPIAISTAVLRYRLFEIEIIIRRTLAYTVLVAMLAAGYFGGMTLSLHRLGAGYSEETRFLLFLSLAMVFDPLRRWLQSTIDRAFERGRMTATEIQRLINRRAVEHRDTSQTLDGIARDVREALRLTACGLALVQEEQLWIVAGDSDLIGQSLPVASLPPVDHWDRGSHPDFIWPDSIAAAIKVTLRDRLVAVLLLGGKRSQEALSSQDFDHLGLFLGQIGVLLSYTQVLDRQQAVDREMQKLLARVSELNDLRASFGIVASHELRTPLTVIQGHAEALMSGIFGNLDPEQQESVQSIFKSATSLSQQINAYLDLVALREKRLVVRASSVDMGTLIHEVLASWTTEIDSKNLDLRLEVEQAAKAYADARRVKQIIEQLIANAVKFTPKGGSVWIQAIADVACVKVQIRDSGPGIDMAKLDQAFDDFAQLEDATQRDHGGLGLGLPLAKGLAEMMGGWLAYSPAPGQGAVFTVALPLAQQPLEPPAHSRRLSLEFPDGLVTPQTAADPKPPVTKHGLDMADVVYERPDDVLD